MAIRTEDVQANEATSRLNWNIGCNGHASNVRAAVAARPAPA